MEPLSETSSPFPDDWLKGLSDIREQRAFFLVSIHLPAADVPRGGPIRGEVRYLTKTPVTRFFNDWNGLIEFIAKYSEVGQTRQTLPQSSGESNPATDKTADKKADS